MSGWTIAGLIAGVVVAWLFFWVAVVMLIARLGGWRTLAAAYPLDRTAFAGTTFSFQSLLLKKYVRYRRCVTFTANADGVMLTPFFMFRPGHRAIFLPWSQVDVIATKVTFMGMTHDVVIISPRRVPAIPITISAATAVKLAQVAGKAWNAKTQALSQAS